MTRKREVAHGGRNITLADLIKLTRRGRSSIYRDIQAGRLPQPFKIGTGVTAKLYFDFAEVDKALEAMKQKSA